MIKDGRYRKDAQTNEWTFREILVIARCVTERYLLVRREKQCGQVVKRRRNYATSQDWAVLHATSIYVKIAGKRGMTCMWDVTLNRLITSVISLAYHPEPSNVSPTSV